MNGCKGKRKNRLRSPGNLTVILLSGGVVGVIALALLQTGYGVNLEYVAMTCSRKMAN